MEGKGSYYIGRPVQGVEGKGSYYIGQPCSTRLTLGLCPFMKGKGSEYIMEYGKGWVRG